MLGLAGALFGISVFFDRDASAVGDSRSLSFYYVHTKDSLNVTYKRNGYYDRDALKQLNYFLRDWRRDEPTDMDPKLFDVLWEVYREAGYEGDTITVMSAYRAPETNAMLRRRSRAVAKYSQHTLGKAMDTSMPGAPMSKIREIGMRLQRGGVGYYPTAGTPFVHLDVGSVRSWPRMSTSQLVSLFPDQKTVHLPSDGPPLAGYQDAFAEIQRNGGSVGGGEEEEGNIGTFFASIFGGGPAKGRTQVASRPTNDGQQLAFAATGGDGAGVRAFLTTDGVAPRQETAPLPRGLAGRRLAGRREAPVVVASNSSDVAPAETAAAAPAPQAKPLPVVEIAEAKAPQDIILPKDASVPLPPRRPSDLLIASLPTSSAPMPPTRPPELAMAPSSGQQIAALDRNTTTQLTATSDAPSDARSAELKAADARLPPPLPPIMGRPQPPSQALGYAATANVASFVPLPPLRGTSPPAPAVKLIPVTASASTHASSDEHDAAVELVARPSTARLQTGSLGASRRQASIQIAALLRDGIVATKFEQRADKLEAGRFVAGMTRPLGASFVAAAAD